MKKRLISMLLAVLMVVSLFSGLSVSAYADNATYNTIRYTLVQGDYVLRICQRLGLNFYVCRDAIMRLNNITEKQWRFLAVGREILLPASDADAVAFLSGKPAATTTATTTTLTTTTVATPAPTTTTKTNNDVLSHYLVPYTMGSGETVLGVCAAMGLSTNAYLDIYRQLIKEVNGLKDLDAVKAGSTYLFPTLNKPAVGTACKAVYVHYMLPGETAYSVCSDVGISYSNNADMLRALNYTKNLNKLKAGQTLFYPIDLVVAPASSGSSSSSSSSASSSSTAKVYKLAADMNSIDGTMSFYVDDKPVTSAKAGDKVHVVVTTNDGKAVKKLTVKHSDGKADLVLTGDTFIMPETDIRVVADIESGYAITLETNYTGKAVATVGGLGVTAASRDSKVMIVSTDPAFEVESVSAYYRSMLGAKKDLAITNNGFAMPEAPVTVKVSLKPVTTYDFYVTTKGMGAFFLSVNGGQVNKAAKGTEVKIVTQPIEGYAVTGWTVTKHGDPSVNVSVFNNTFIMPGFDVDVEVVFGEKGNNIVFMPAKGGSAHAEVGGATVTEADTGATVTLKAEALDDYQIDHYTVVRNKDGYKVTVTKSGSDYTFEMPAGGATVTPVFVGKTAAKLTVDLYLDGKKVTTKDYLVAADVTVSSSSGDTKTSVDLSGASISAKSGDYISIVPDAPKNMAFDKIKVTNGSAPIAEYASELKEHGFFEITKDAATVTIEVYFVSDKLALPAAAITGAGTVGYVASPGGESISTANVNDTVFVSVKPGAEYYFDHSTFDGTFCGDLKVTRKDTGAELPLTQELDGEGNPTGFYGFTVPDCGVNVQVTFKPAKYMIYMTCEDEKGHDLTGESLWSISVGGSNYIVDNNFSVVNANANDLVWVKMTETGKENYNMVSFKLNDTYYTSSVKNFQYSFFAKSDVANSSGVINIVAVMRPKAADKSIALKASINNEKFGNVGFLVTASPSGYSTVDSAYDSVAYGGDTVVIIPSTTAAGYTIDAEHITITNQKGGVIHPTPVTVDGKQGYEFVMPSDGYKSISVKFYPISYKATIKVMDGSNDITAYGFVNVALDGVNYKDVFSGDALGEIAYTKQISVTTTEMARNSGWKFVSLTVAPTCEVTKISNGASFKMPAADAVITVNLTGGTVPPTPPAAVPVTLPDKDADGRNLQYYKDAAMTEVLSDLSVMSGETYYVKVMNPPVGGNLSSIELQKSASETLGTGDPSTGMFTVPAGMTIVKTTYNFNSYKLVIAVENEPATYTVSVKPGTDSAVEVTPGSTQVDVDYGESVEIKVTGDRKIKSVDGLDGFTLDSGDKSGTGTLKPASSVPNGGTVTVTVKFAVEHEMKFSLVNDKPGTAKVTYSSTDYADGEETSSAKLAAGTSVSLTASREVAKVEGLDNVSISTDKKTITGDIPDTSEDLVPVTVTFESHVTLKFKFENDVGGANTVKVNGHEVKAATPTVGPFLPGEEITLSAASRTMHEVKGFKDYKEDSDKKGGKGFIPTGGSDGQEITISVTFAAKYYKLNFKASGDTTEVVFGNASNTPDDCGGTGLEMSPYYVGEIVHFYAPEGYHFTSASSTVLDDITWGENWKSCKAKVNASGTDGAKVDVNLALAKDPS